MVHHGDEKIEQNDDVDDGVGAEHEEAPEAREALDAHQFKVVQIDETESGPEERLRRLKQAVCAI